jgi:ribosome-associated toxin RatA of RatAB toxin-antitoxin module
MAEASSYINELFQPLQEVTVYAMLPQPLNSAHEAILPVYEGNIRLLEMTMKLSDLNSDVQSYQRNIINMQRSLTEEENKTKDAIIAATVVQREITEIQQTLKEVQDKTNTILYEQSQAAWQKWESGESMEGSFANESKKKSKVHFFMDYFRWSNQTR